jgi:hypothetical protein
MMGKVSEVPKEKCKDRILVQSAPYDEQFKKTGSYTEEIKLKCSYTTSGGDETTTTTATAAAAPATRDLRKRPNAAAPVASNEQEARLDEDLERVAITFAGTAALVPPPPCPHPPLGGQPSLTVATTLGPSWLPATELYTGLDL